MLYPGIKALVKQNFWDNAASQQRREMYCINPMYFKALPQGKENLP